MESKTKQKIEFARLEAIVQRAFGLRACVVQAAETSDGFFNTVWRVVVDPTGQAARPGAGPSPQTRTCYLKIAPPKNVKCMRYEANMMAAEYQVLGALNAATLPVPEILYFDQDSGIVDSSWMFTSAIPGIAWRYVREHVSDDTRAAIDREIGILSARIAKIRGAWFGLPGMGAGKHRNWPDAFRAMIEILIADAVESGADLHAEIGEVRGFLVKAHDALSQVRVPQLVHWDLWEGNVFVVPTDDHDPDTFPRAYTGGLKVSGIIDCERAMWADPLMEFGFRGFVRNQDFLNAYGEERHGEPFALDSAAEIRCMLYDLHLFMILQVEPHFRGYATEGPEVWARHQITALLPKIREALK